MDVLTPNSISKPSSLLRCISLTWAGSICLDTELGSLTRASASPLSSSVMFRIQINYKVAITSAHSHSISWRVYCTYWDLYNVSTLLINIVTAVSI